MSAVLGQGEPFYERLEIQELDSDHDNVLKKPYVQFLSKD